MTKIKIEKFQNLNPFLRGIYRDMPEAHILRFTKINYL